MRFVVTTSLVMLAVGVAGSAPLSAQSSPAKPQSAVAAPATQANGGKVGFVNAGALLKGMPGYTQAESTYVKEAQAADTEAQKIRAAFDSAYAQYDQAKAMMTPSNRTAREAQLRTQADSVQVKLQALQNQVQAREQELLAPMQDRLRAVIDGFRAEGNYAMIIDLSSQFAAAIIAYDKGADITLRVAQRLAQSN
jgi:outer membrane protein